MSAIGGSELKAKDLQQLVLSLRTFRFVGRCWLLTPAMPLDSVQVVFFLLKKHVLLKKC